MLKKEDKAKQEAARRSIAGGWAGLVGGLSTFAAIRGYLSMN
jgi:hypothetical protein